VNHKSLATVAKLIIRQRKAGNEKAFTWCGETKSKTMIMACLDNASVVLSFCLSPPSFYAHCFLWFYLPLFSPVSSSVAEVMKEFYRPSPLFHSASGFLSSCVLCLPLALCFQCSPVCFLGSFSSGFSSLFRPKIPCFLPPFSVFSSPLL